MKENFRLLILGAYGVFGSQIVESLCQEPNLDILIAGRTLCKAQALTDRLSDSSTAQLSALVIDAVASSLNVELASLRIDLVINTCGPFQGQNYHVAE